jgi:signal peptidase I
MNPTAASLTDAHAVKCELAGEVLHSSGSLRLGVTGWSMLPSVWPGDTLVIERANHSAVSEGDIVLFRRDRRLFAHRIVKRNGAAGNAEILTRGDALPRPDPPLTGRDLLGKVRFIVRNGKCIEPSRTPRLSQRAVAALVRNSEFAARVVVGVHGMRQKLQN